MNIAKTEKPDKNIINLKTNIVKIKMKKKENGCVTPYTSITYTHSPLLVEDKLTSWWKQAREALEVETCRHKTRRWAAEAWGRRSEAW